MMEKKTNSTMAQKNAIHKLYKCFRHLVVVRVADVNVVEVTLANSARASSTLAARIRASTTPSVSRCCHPEAPSTTTASARHILPG